MNNLKISIKNTMLFSEAQLRLPGWKIDPGSYIGFSKNATITHLKCGSEIIATPQLISINPSHDCPCCGKRSWCKSIRPKSKASLNKSIAYRSNGHLSLAPESKFERRDEKRIKDHIQVLVKCNIDKDQQPYLMNFKDIRTNTHSQCKSCESVYSHKPRAFILNEAVEFASMRNATILEADGVKNSVFIARNGEHKKLIEIARDEPLHRHGVMSASNAESIELESLRNEYGPFFKDEAARIKSINAMSLTTSKRLIAILLNINESHVGYLCRKNKTKSCVKDGFGKQIKNHIFFRNKSLLSSYWAGFIAADGNIFENQIIKICLHFRDEFHLISLMKGIGYTGKVAYSEKSPSNTTYSAGLYCELAFSSKYMIDDLRHIYGISGIKTRNPFCIIPKIRSSKIAFLAGIIDGDGTIRSNHKIDITTVSNKAAALICAAINSDFGPESASFKLNKNRKCWNITMKAKSSRLLYAEVAKLELPILDRKWNKLSTPAIRRLPIAH